MPPKSVSLPSILYEETVRRALREDLGRAGDLTSDAIVPADATAAGKIVARAPGCVAGLEVALFAFRLLDPQLEERICVPDGNLVRAGQTLASVRGRARALLAVERTALNLLGRVSGIATATHQVVERVKGTSVRVICTRKTTPGLRVLEKYAIRAGGGYNHRFGLDDAVLIKDNHLLLAGGIRPAVQRVRASTGHMVKVEVEVDTLEQLQEALELGVDAVLLDNMDAATVKKAVQMVGKRLLLEVSGGVTPENVRELAQTGVDLISLGWLTHSAPALDVALDLECQQAMARPAPGSNPGSRTERGE